MSDTGRGSVPPGTVCGYMPKDPTAAPTGVKPIQARNRLLAAGKTAVFPCPWVAPATGSTPALQVRSKKIPGVQWDCPLCGHSRTVPSGSKVWRDAVAKALADPMFGKKGGAKRGKK
jgi:hypothetical protein